MQLVTCNEITHSTCYLIGGTRISGAVLIPTRALSNSKPADVNLQEILLFHGCSGDQLI